ncbi:conserved exported hypothetical protein [Burkholderiales bacterium]|nr:conserved exported hypothetical protein [Burkholderiales bacterium]
MTARRIPILLHLLGAAAASALAAYWVLRLLAPAPSIVPPAAPAVAIREPDAVLAARMFGDVSSGPAAASLNVQVTGVFAAGADSSAVVAVEGRPSRAVLLGREVAPGLRLVEVRRDGVTLEHDGARTQYDVPALSVAKSSSAAAMFRREGDTLTAPSQDVSSPGAKASGSVRSLVNSALLPASQAAPPVPPGGVGRLAPDETPMPGRPAQPGSNPPYIPMPGVAPGSGAAPPGGSGG